MYKWHVDDTFPIDILFSLHSCDDSLFFECVGLYLYLRTIDYF